MKIKTNYRLYFHEVECARCSVKKSVLKILEVSQENTVVEICEIFKGALSGLRHFLATERNLKMMKNAFYFS